ncbi:hypothetical protein HYS48_03940 [Candidatus Woesearchaeota archaeon]|nr:hypothetical protein [Candidatus Woesearchaeota archaeon]
MQSAKIFIHEGVIICFGKTFTGTFTEMPAVDWEQEIEQLDLNSFLKQQMKEKLQDYLKKFEKNVLVMV